MLVIAVANGAFRQLVIAKVMPELRAHQISTAIGSILIGLFIWGVIRIWPPISGRQAFSIGLLWLVLTVAFEFALGRLVMHNSWVQLLTDYNVFEGRVWTIFLIWLTAAPYVFFHFRRS